MSIVNSLQTGIPQPLDAQTTAFFALVQREWTRLQALLDQGAQLVWSNPSGATPQQVVASFGANAAALFAASNALCALIGAITGTTPSPMPAGWNFTANGDGTVTLTAPA